MQTQINQPLQQQRLTSLKLKTTRKSLGIDLGAALIYLIGTAFLDYRSVGLQYDEAILQHGAVSLLASPDNPTFAHDHGSWIPFARRH